MKATVDYNIALARLFQAVGTVLDIRSVKKSLPVITSLDKPARVIAAEDNEIDKRITSELHKSSLAQKVKKEDRSPDVTIISSKTE